MKASVQTLAAAARAGLTVQQAALERAIVETVAYADVFEFPLTTDELHRYLIGVQAGRGAVREALTNGRVAPAVLTKVGR
jgi:hypothetical protein